jgi:hypothetical protein
MMQYADTGTVVDGWLTRNDDERIFWIRKQIFESIRDPLVLWVARAMVSNCPSRDEGCELASLYKKVKYGPIPIPIYDESKRQVVRVMQVQGFDERTQTTYGLRFVEDPLGIDNYPSAGKTLEWLSQGVNGEDCDGHSIFVCSLAMSLSYMTGVVIASRDGRNYTHIFPVVAVPKLEPTQWISMDTSWPQAEMGWWPTETNGVRKMKLYALKPGKIEGRRIL